MGIWSTTATSAGGAIQQQRWWGVLELLVAAPTRLILVLAPVTVAISGIGVYSIVSTLLWGRLLFGVPIQIEHLLLFAVSIPVAVLSIGLLGLVLASTFVLYRSASSLSQALEYPIWTITGMLIPLSLLPGWIGPIAWVLAPTWGMEAVRNSALGGDVLEAAPALHRLEPGVHRALDAASASLRTPRARTRDALADMRTWLRIFFIGGAISFRALFSWIRPSVYIPTLLIGPTTQVLFFAYLGRTAHLEYDSWFVVGNAVKSASIAALFGMGLRDRRRALDADALGGARDAGRIARRSSSVVRCRCSSTQR